MQYIYFCSCRVVRFWWSWAQLGQTFGSLGATVSPRKNINSTSVQVLSLVRFPFFGSRQNFSQGTKDPCVKRFDQIIWQNTNLSGRVSSKQTDDSKDINAATYLPPLALDWRPNESFDETWMEWLWHERYVSDWCFPTQRFDLNLHTMHWLSWVWTLVWIRWVGSFVGPLSSWREGRAGC